MTIVYCSFTKKKLLYKKNLDYIFVQILQPNLNLQF